MQTRRLVFAAMLPALLTAAGDTDASLVESCWLTLTRIPPASVPDRFARAVRKLWQGYRPDQRQRMLNILSGYPTRLGACVVLELLEPTLPQITQGSMLWALQRAADLLPLDDVRFQQCLLESLADILKWPDTDPDVALRAMSLATQVLRLPGFPMAASRPKGPALLLAVQRWSDWDDPRLVNATRWLQRALADRGTAAGHTPHRGGPRTAARDRGRPDRET